MTDLYLTNISPRAMALRAAFDGDIKLFEAIVNAANVTVASIASFKTFSDYHVGETFYLVYELVKSGNYAMLKHVVGKYDLSLMVHEERIKGLIDARAMRKKWETETEEGRRIAAMYINDDPNWLLRETNPYHADSLILYAEKLLKAKNGEYDTLREHRSAARALGDEDQANAHIKALDEKLDETEILFHQIQTCLEYVKEKVQVPA